MKLGITIENLPNSINTILCWLVSHHISSLSTVFNFKFISTHCFCELVFPSIPVISIEIYIDLMIRYQISCCAIHSNFNNNDPQPAYRFQMSHRSLSPRKSISKRNIGHTHMSIHWPRLLTYVYIQCWAYSLAQRVSKNVICYVVVQDHLVYQLTFAVRWIFIDNNKRAHIESNEDLVNMVSIPSRPPNVESMRYHSIN